MNTSNDRISDTQLAVLLMKHGPCRCTGAIKVEDYVAEQAAFDTELLKTLHELRVTRTLLSQYDKEAMKLLAEYCKKTGGIESRGLEL